MSSKFFVLLYVCLDDACATVAKFCLDCRSHGTKSLAGPRLQEFQGPGLLSYNNSTFSPEDFISIQRIGDSMKRASDNKDKIGRFGIGFNAIYHITDLPSFVSGDKFVMLDPHACYLPNVNPSNPGKIVDFISNPGAVSSFSDQFAPYLGVEGLDFKSSFKGTLFRFPLRSSNQARTSSLSKRHLEPSDVMVVLDDLKREASSMMLFLKHIERLEILVWNEGDSAPTLVFGCHISNMSKELQLIRKSVTALEEKKKDNFSGTRLSDYFLDIIIKDYSTDSSLTENWAVCNQLGGSVVNDIANNPENSLQRLIPWGGAAACISKNGDASLSIPTNNGLAFCFLPLPISTGLPVMINAFFELSSNRRDIWQPGSDMTGTGQTRALWNVELLRHVISPCYARLLQVMKNRIGWSTIYQEYWPSVSISKPWNEVASHTLKLMRDMPSLSNQNCIDILSKKIDVRETPSWFAIKDVYLAPITDDKDMLVCFFTLFKVPIVDGEESFLRSLEESKLSLGMCTPESVRSVLRALKPKILTESSEASTFYDLSGQLLRYCCSDLSKDYAKELSGLPLLPLCNGRVTDFFYFDSSKATMINSIVEMGFPLSSSINALISTNFHIESAFEILGNSSRLKLSCTVAIVSTPEELNIFGGKFSSFIQIEHLKSRELEILSEVSNSCSSNVRKFGCEVMLDILFDSFPILVNSTALAHSSFGSEDAHVAFKATLRKLWNYVLKNHEYFSVLVNGPPIVPIVNSHYVTLSKNSMILVNKMNSVELSEAMSAILNTLGAQIMDLSFLPEDASFPPTMLSNIFIPRRLSVIELISLLFKKNPAIFSELSRNDCNALGDYLSTAEPISSLSTSDVAAIVSFPLFSLYSVENLVAIKNGKYMFVLGSEKLPVSMLDANVLVPSESFNSAFFRKMGVELITRSQYIARVILKNPAKYYSETKEDYFVFLQSLVSDFGTLATESHEIIDALKTSRFIPNRFDELFLISELFDPHSDTLSAILPEKYFPSRKLEDESSILFLRSLGLNNLLEWPTIKQCAIDISQDHNVNRAWALLRFLDNNYDELMGIQKSKPQQSIYSLVSSMFSDTPVNTSSNKTNMEALMTIPWVPCDCKESKYLPYYPDEFVAPSKCRPVSENYLCSASYGLIRYDIKSKGLKNTFGWNRPLKLRDVVTQLIDICKMRATLPSDLEYDTYLTTIVPRLYERINALCENDHQVVKELCTVPWIWIGNAFVDMERVAYECTVSFFPILIQLPPSLRSYSQLLSCFNIRKKFNGEDILRALFYLSNEVVTNKNPELVNTCINLMNSVGSSGDSIAITTSLNLPDSNGNFVDSSDLVFDDIPWKIDDELMSFRSKFQLLHPNISLQIAKLFGIRSLRLIHLQSNADQSIFSSNNVDFQAFGQAESLTSRIKSILNQYPDGYPVFSELIQNADDAGASRISLAIDYSTYGTESLLDNKMKELQGPSLLVFNDAVFSESDFKALAQIGQGSKVKKLDTTGRFGLGFSSVYHITDTPSFVSGEFLTIFDPHCEYVPGANPHQPGIRLKFLSKRVSETFTDQFQPFRYFGCDFKSEFAGTLFRFPLRSNEMSKASEISSRPYLMEDMEKNLAMLESQLGQHALYLRSIKEISLFAIDQAGGNPRLIANVNCKTTNISSVNDMTLLHFFDKNYQGGSNNTREDFHRLLQNTADKDLPQSVTSREIVIVNNIKSDGTNDTTKHVYLTVSGLCGGEAKKMSCNEDVRHLKLVPFGSVSICLRSRVNDEIISFPSIKGQVFCYLPLPIFTGFPVHMNAYWELSSNRRDIWTGDDTIGEAKYRSDWNKLILKDILVPLYSQLLKYCVDEIIQRDISPEKIFSLFPFPLKPYPWDLLSTSLIQVVSNEKLFWCNKLNQGWVSPKECLIVEEKDMSSSIDSLLKYDMCEKMLEFDIPVAFLPKVMHAVYVEHGYSSQDVTPQLIREIFSGKSEYSTIRDKCFQVRNSSKDNALFFLTMALKDITRQTYSSIKGVELIPLSDGSFTALCDFTQEKAIYLANENERDLVAFANHRIISLEAIADSTISKTLRDPTLLEETNIRLLTSESLLYLIHTVYSDLVQCNSIFVDYQSSFSDSWLVSLWKFIINTKSLDLFRDSIHILPVMSKSSETCAVRVCNDIPVIRNSKAFSPTIIDCFSDLGIFVFKDIVKLDDLNIIFSGDGKGVVSCLKICAMILKSVSSGWSNTKRDVFSEFLLDHVLDKVEDLSKTDLSLMASMHIWKDYALEYHALDEINLFIPPPKCDAEFLGSNFVHLRHDRERSKFKSLGVEEVSTARFYCDFLSQRICNGQLRFDSVNKVASYVLYNIKDIENERADSIALWSKVPFVKNLKGVHCCPSDLYDPNNGALKVLLPSERFPSNEYAQLDAHLKLLGLKSTLSTDMLLVVAKSIEEESKTEKEMPGSVELRGMAFLDYLESHVQSILEEVDPEGLRLFIENHVDGNDLGGNWGNILRSIQFVSVYTEPPVDIDRLPWPKALHNSIVAAPRECTVGSNVWLSSMSLRISRNSPRKNLSLMLLGWHKPVSGRTLVDQLRTLEKDYAQETGDKKILLRNAYSKHIPSIYEAICKLIDRCSSNDSSCDLLNINSQDFCSFSCVWNNYGFFPVENLVFESNSSINFDPYLISIQGDLLKWASLWKFCGVKDSLSFEDIIAVSQRIFSANKGSVVSLEIQKMILELIKMLCTKLRQTYDISNDDAQEEETVFPPICQQIAKQFYILDNSNKLANPQSLVINDANWLAPSQYPSILFVNDRITDRDALLMGARSWRASLYSGDKISCPEIAFVNELAGTDPLKWCFLDIISFGETIGTKNISVVLDTATYQSQSLMNPKLSRAQDPALIFVLEDACIFDAKMLEDELSCMKSCSEYCCMNGHNFTKEEARYPRAGKGLVSAFRFSDCLQIISGDKYYLFDPLGSYTEQDGNVAKGQMCNLFHTSSDGLFLVDRFPNQFEPFITYWPKNDFKTKKSFRGVMIRLPLRSVSSNLCNMVCTIDDIENLFHEMFDKLGGSILFSHSFNSICIKKLQTMLYQYSVASSLRRFDRFDFFNDKSWKTSLLGMYSSYKARNVSWSLSLKIEFSAMWWNDYVRCCNFMNDEEKSVLFVNDERLTVSLNEVFELLSVFGSEYNLDMCRNIKFRQRKLQPIATIACHLFDINTPFSLSFSRILSGSFFCSVYPMEYAGFPFILEGPFLQIARSRAFRVSSQGSSPQKRLSTIVFGPTNDELAISSDDIGFWNSSLLTAMLNEFITPYMTSCRDRFQKQKSLLYDVWPYLDGIKPHFRHIAERSLMKIKLSEGSYFLVKDRFGKIGESYHFAEYFPPRVVEFLSSCVTMSSTPYKAIADIALPGSQTVLKPSALRSTLSNISVSGMDFNTVVYLLSYCLSDIVKCGDIGARKRLLAELHNCSLLPLATKTNASISRESVKYYYSSGVLQHWIPALQKQSIHGLARELLPILKDVDVSKSLSIETLSVTNFSKFISHCFPSLSKSLCVLRSHLSQDGLLYALWQDLFSLEPSRNALLSLKEWPILPVISRSRQLLVSVSALPYLFCMEPNSSQLEIASSNQNEYNTIKEKYDKSIADAIQDYKTFAMPPQSLKPCILYSNREFTKKRMDVSESNLPVEGRVREEDRDREGDEEEDGELQTGSDSIEDIENISIALEPHVSTDSSYLSNQPLIDVLVAMGYPFLDTTLVATLPVLLKNFQLSPGRRLLQGLSNMQFTLKETSDGEDVPMIDFRSLDEEQRNILLLEINASHVDQPFQASELVMVKSLPLFSCVDGNIVQINNAEKVYYCANMSIIGNMLNTFLNGNSSLSSSSSSAIILKYDPSLVGIYRMLDIEELTVQKSASAFILPALESMRGSNRVDHFVQLASSWSTYKGDRAFVDNVKNLSLIPNWDVESENVDYGNLRKCSDLLDWNNPMITSTIGKGDHENLFFPPPSFRSNEMHQMMMDLGLQRTIDMNRFIFIAKSISSQIQRCEKSNTLDSHQIQHIKERSTKLLRYLNSEDVVLQLSKKDGAILCDIKFIPVQYPLRLEHGCHMVFEHRFVSFRNTLGYKNRDLAFSIYPVLDKAICPPQFYFSSLEIITLPSQETVIEHLRNLLSRGETLDKWNYPSSTAVDCFSTLFEYLNEQWTSLSKPFQEWLSKAPLIPLGNYFVPCPRMFFKLPIDLSPLLFEVPIYFGRFEKLFTSLGVKATPLAVDYINFLRDMEEESRGSSLNVNEIRAVISIIEKITSEESLEATIKDYILYIPDEYSVLRDSSRLLFNNDHWISERHRDNLNYQHYYLMHPAIGMEMAVKFFVPKVGDVLQEILEETNSKECISQELDDFAGISRRICQQEFCASLYGLVFHEMATIQSHATTLQVYNEHSNSFVEVSVEHLTLADIASTMRSIDILMMETLEVSVVLVDCRSQKKSAVSLSAPGLSSSSFFVERCADRICLRINSQEINELFSASSLVALGLCKIMGLNSATSFVIRALIDCSDSSTTTLISPLRIGTDARFLEERLRGVPGELVNPIDRRLIEFVPLRTYRLGELVAIKRSLVDSESSEDPEHISNVDIESSDLIYCKIVEIGTQDASGLQYLVIRCGKDLKRVFNTSVLSFKSGRSCKQVNSMMSSSPSKHKVNHAHRSTPSKAKDSSSGVVNNSFDLSISSADVIAALQDMLIRSGIPMDAEKETMMKRILALEENNKQILMETKRQQ